MFVLRQDILDFKAWEDHMESDHLTILVWGFRLGQLVPARYNIVTGPIQVSDDEGYQPEEGLMSLIHCAHEDEIPTEVSLMYIYLINYI